MSDLQTTRPSQVQGDPSAIAVARVYATAFLNAAGPDQQAELLEEFTSFYDDVLVANPEFNRLLTTAITGSEQKKGLIERAVQPFASEKFTNFLQTLAKHDRLELIPVILTQATEIHEARTGQLRVKVRSAIELTSQQLDRIQQRLRDALSLEPILIPSLDPDLLGGLVVQVGDTVYDGSLRTRLRELRQRLRERYLNEIQSGRDRFNSPEGN